MSGAARTVAALGVTAALAAAAGCGGSGSEVSVSGTPATGIDEEGAVAEIEAVAERFDRIVASKNTRAFCRILAPSAVQRLGAGEFDGRRKCLEVWARGRNPLFRAQPDPDLRAEKVELHGAYATARLANGGELAFSHEGGRWYVRLTPGRGEGGKR